MRAGIEGIHRSFLCRGRGAGSSQEDGCGSRACARSANPGADGVAILFTALLLAAPAGVLAGANPFNPQQAPSRYVEPEKKPEQEAEVALPVYPDKRDTWIPFETTAVSRNRFFVDRASLSITEDRTIRYALIIESPSGVRNVSYEGMRCSSAEIKTYAWGTSEGKWYAAKQPQWQQIRVDRINGQHVTLYERYFCQAATGMRTAEDIIRVMQQKDSRVPTTSNPLRLFTQ